MSLLGSFGKVLGTVAKGVVGFATGGIGGAATALAARPAASPAAVTPFAGFGGGGPIVGGTARFGPIEISGGVGKTTSYGGGLRITGGAPSNGQCPRGYHLNKSALPASKTHGAAPPRSICVRNRHVNALNGRAASRALRRLKRADKMTRKIHSLFHRPTRHTAKGKR